MIVNAFVDSATIVAIAYALARVLSGGWAIAAMIISTAINAVPFGYDNVVLGFNTHFYLLITFSFAALWLSDRQPGMVAALGGRVVLRNLLVDVPGLRRVDPRGGDRSASSASHVRAPNGAPRMAWPGRARRRHRSHVERHSARAAGRRIEVALDPAGALRVRRAGELARPLERGIGLFPADGVLCAARLGGPACAERSALVQYRGARLGLEPNPGARRRERRPFRCSIAISTSC